MMKTILYKFLTILLVILPLHTKATGIGDNYGGGGKYTKKKTIKKEFEVNSDALFKVKNSYGSLNITSWNEDRVVLEVIIKTNGNDEEKVQERLDEIDVTFENTRAMVSATTQFVERKSKWGWKWGKRNNVNVKVSYSVKIPVKNNVHLSNDYGNIYLDRVDGHAKISCDYGKMEIGELRGRNNELRFDYTSRSSFDYIESATIYADYSGFTVERAGDLSLRTDYTNAVIKKMGNLEYASDYGSIQVDQLKNLNGNGSYIGIKLGDVYGDVKLTADYGSLKINRLTPEAGDVHIKSDYTGIKIGYDPEYHFDFDITTEYAGVCGMDDLDFQVKKEKSTEKYYNGYHGNDNSGNVVYIDTEYGGVTFYKN